MEMKKFITRDKDYLIDENGIIVKAFKAVKAADNPKQMLESIQ